MTWTCTSRQDTFHVWVVALAEGRAKLLVADLVELGWAVGMLGDVLCHGEENRSSVVIPLQITWDRKGDKDVADAYNDVLKCLNQQKAPFHSVVVAEGVENSIWCASNVVVNQEDTVSTKAKQGGKGGHLALVKKGEEGVDPKEGHKPSKPRDSGEGP